MCKNHTPAAVSFELQFIESVTIKEAVEIGKEATRGGIEDRPFAHVFCKEVKVGVPFVTNDFPA
jgi:hypothetical protein